MRERYEKSVLTITRFGEEDVIATSEFDRNNAYRGLEELDKPGTRVLPDH